MVRSVNGDRGSSVIPIPDTADDYVFLGRGRHVITDGSKMHMNGLSGALLEDGIAASGNSKRATLRNVANTMKSLLLIQIGNTDDYILKYGGPEIS